ncbi:hypothetical protein T265_07928 [Opisthorchis viverrini]|uniref:Type I phosphodiesterase / nucleotide pyrophosphatase n=1 Tax=Opisthorchis viverrini TaxID=6198 RepID=A0A074ZAT2_OPIVI|nr:hypothetical protein T265_07928 [Opisthorchis viverrini]KER24416.1 hypothetical protein T265_07928 [Opisthorchis viverrini]
MSNCWKLFIYLSITSSVGATPISDTDGRTKLLLISFDGFRHDYLDKASSSGVNISGFLKIWESGFRVLRVKNEFVTSTSSNHFSMVTGQHPESHGIVDNSFFDPMLNRTFAFSNGTQAKESVWFDVGAEPIWVTNQLHGHRTAMTSWTGAFAPIKNILPSISYPAFDPTIPLRKSIDDVIGWLETDVNLALLYHIEPDLTGHRYGPDSTEVLKAIGTLNNEVEYLLERVQKSPKLAHSLNIIIASDHGMAEVDPTRLIVLDDYLNSTMYNSSRESPAVVWGLWPEANDIVDRLENRHPYMHAYKKEDVPERWFYSRSPRIAPVIVFADVGWVIVKSSEYQIKFKKGGKHGYDPASPEMSPFLLATGPGFKPPVPNHTIQSMDLIDIYPMMCHLLGLENPGPHNGSLSHVAHVLRDRSAAERNKSFHLGIIFFLLIWLINVFA